jgi:hypothetical protein
MGSVSIPFPLRPARPPEKRERGVGKLGGLPQGKLKSERGWGGGK